MEKQKNKIEEESNIEIGISETEGFLLESELAQKTVCDIEDQINQETDPVVKNKLTERLTSYVRRIVGITGIAGLALSLNHVRVHNNNIEKTTHNNKTEYLHSDEKSNRILRYVTGQEPLSQPEKEILFREYISGLNIDLPKDLNNLSMEEIDKQVRYLPKPASEIFGEQWIDSIIKSPPSFDAKYYEALHEIFIETGSPKIRFTKESGERIHYVPLEHTIYIANPVFGGGDLTKSIIAELSHAKQFTEKPIASYTKAIKSGFDMLGKFIERGGKDSFRKIQLEEYDEHGSLEHEAHSEIEPQLKNSLNKKLED